MSTDSPISPKRAAQYRLCDPKYFSEKAKDRKNYSAAVRKYYRDQSSLLERYNEDREHLAPLSLMKSRKSDLESDKEKACDRERVLENVSFACNFALLIGKIVALIYSDSLSILSSMIDSFVDNTSNVVIWVTSRAVRNRDPYHYPRGRTRLVPLGLIIISVIMGVASLRVIVKSVEAVIKDEVDPKFFGKFNRSIVKENENGSYTATEVIKEVDWRVLGVMISTIVIKLVLGVTCYIAARFSPTITVLAQDHRNDCLSNTVAVACGMLGAEYWKHIDSIGAILISIYIAVSWLVTGHEQIAILTGHTAPPYFISRIIKVCVDHDEQILHVDAVTVYHFGTQFIVEVDIVLDEKMTVRRSHDISEPLQRKIEHLDDVERAFVHVDYQTKHTSSIEHKEV